MSPQSPSTTTPPTTRQATTRSGVPPVASIPTGRPGERPVRRVGGPALLAAALGATAAVSPFAAAPAEAAPLPAPQASPLTGPVTGAVPVVAASAAASAGSYQVRAGDTLSAIAARTGTSVRALVAANSLSSPDVLATGQMITVPATGAAAPAAATGTTGSAGVVTVRSGETLGGIAQRAGTTVAALVTANGLRSADVITAGQRLTVPGAGAAAAPASTPAPTAAATGATVTVVAGDTLGAIAAAAGVPLSALLASSGLDRSTPIRPGQRITLPADAEKSAPMATSFAGRDYAPHVTAAATNNRDALAARDVPSRAEVREIIERTALEMGVDPALALAVGYQESGFDASAVSPANALGAMQVIPSSGRWASQLVGRDLDLLDPEDNAVAGVAILRALVRSADDLPMAIAGYYQGLAGVRANGVYDDTRRYVANIQTLMTRFA